jgi:hypothetical protein
VGSPVQSQAQPQIWSRWPRSAQASW